MAATWDRSLLHSIAKATGEEFRGKGIAATGPFFNLYRTPLAGRSKEGYGADPYLVLSVSYFLAFFPFLFSLFISQS